MSLYRNFPHGPAEWLKNMDQQEAKDFRREVMYPLVVLGFAVLGIVGTLGHLEDRQSDNAPVPTATPTQAE